MQSLVKKISELLSLLKAVTPKQVVAPTIPQLPAIKPPTPPSMKASIKGTKLPGVSPDSKKDPRKVAQQIKDGSMSTKTQKLMFKAEECIKVDKNGQWTIEKTEDK